MDASVRLAALARMEGLDDARVTKALEALANDPNLHVAQRVREVLTARTGEAFRRGPAAPELGEMGLLDYWRVAGRLLARHPVPLIGTAVATMVVLPMLVPKVVRFVVLPERIVALIVNHREGIGAFTLPLRK